MEKLIIAARAVRVSGWLHFLGLFLLGWAWAGAGKPASAALGLAAGALYLSFTFGVNNLFDRDMDPGAKNPFAAGALSPRAGAAAMAALSLSSLVLAFAAGSCMGALFIFMNLASFGYSGPLRLKRLFCWGSLLNVPIFAPLFLAGCCSVRPLRPGDLAWTLLFSVTVLVVQVAQELSDREGDEAGGIRTTALVLGEKRSLALLSALSGLRVALAALFWAGGLAGPLTLFFCLAAGLGEALVARAFSPTREFSRMRMGLRFVNMAFGFAMLGLFLIQA